MYTLCSHYVCIVSIQADTIIDSGVFADDVDDSVVVESVNEGKESRNFFDNIKVENFSSGNHSDSRTSDNNVNLSRTTSTTATTTTGQNPGVEHGFRHGAESGHADDSRGFQSTCRNSSRHSNEAFATGNRTPSVTRQWNWSAAQWTTIVTVLFILASLSTVNVFLACQKRWSRSQFLREQSTPMQDTQYASNLARANTFINAANRGPVGSPELQQEIFYSAQQSNASTSSVFMAEPACEQQSAFFQVSEGRGREKESSFCNNCSYRFSSGQFASWPRRTDSTSGTSSHGM